MTIRYKCEACGAALDIWDELVGTQGNCPGCQTEFSVPDLTRDVADANSETCTSEPAAPAGEELSADAIANFLANDHQAVAPGRSSRDKTKASGKTAVPMSDSADAATIAKKLMARPYRATSREKQSGSGPCGRFDDRRVSEDAGRGPHQAVHLLTSQGIPYLVGGVAIFAALIWLFHWLFWGSTEPPLAHITGTVTLDGKPLPNAVVRFQPLQDPAGKPTLDRATSIGFTGNDGKYSLIYRIVDEKRIMGASLGRHLVVINATDETGGELLPVRYSKTSRSELKADLVKGIAACDFLLNSQSDSASK